MVSNFISRLFSAFAIGSIAIWAIVSGGLFFQILMMICVSIMIYEWISINNQKNSLMFLIGNFYILIPMLFWIYESRYFPKTLSTNVLWAFTIVWSCDIFAYFGGKLLKGPKFSPKISPNKTWSGVIVGSTVAFIVSYFYILKFMNANSILIICSVFMIVASVLGDLLESKIKRVLGVKDTGNIIPGHGGVCDRLDSFLLVTYVFIIIKFILL